MTDPHHIVVVGGGIAGLEIASRLPRRTRGIPIAVTLVDREPAYVWKPMLHTIAAGTSDSSQQQTSYVSQACHRRFVFQPGELKGVDRVARKVHVGEMTVGNRCILPERALPYDTLILATGSHANDFGTPGVRDHCYAVASRSQALHLHDEIRTRILEGVAAQSNLVIAVVGGGATGIELTAELIQLTEIAAYYGATGLPGRVKVFLVESSPRLLAAFPERVAKLAHERLEKLGITILTGARVVSADAEGLRLVDGSRIYADLQICAAGVKAADVLASIDGLEVIRNNQLVIGPTLQTTRDPRIFAIGDCASLTCSPDARPLLPTAQVAHQQAAHLIHHIPAWLHGAELPSFRYRDFGSLVSLGGYGAYAALGKFGLLGSGFIKGRVVQLGHILLYRSHQSRLHGFWRGSLIWLADIINSYVRPRLRLS